ncbi:MAG: phage integrase N-terminal SAM-like domain-containing protein [Candidatus Thiodiazotropha sp. (ex Lucinoma borealis)]|nr:phage integrase N-terminal SAM-like domain-containing protein [Candidatus Thiodiazotropha sp. (ex Lucinoma borealis)]MCU7838645.1 phage integrase N-terminal SAM-like domain-containing protein [Candidatus Thiodiazotropha sp. (ex Troendleina suluensis)]MCU7947756.1 phage integrase N-terminal SAM-like domain-containing protein [Candidatus Thiodiazotropha sp. (ex Cardiolucina cf. quadrata)]
MEISAYLEYLAVQGKVSVSTHKVILNSLIYIYREVLGKNLDHISAFTCASAQRRLPTV